MSKLPGTRLLHFACLFCLVLTRHASVDVELDVDGSLEQEDATAFDSYPVTCHAWTGGECDWEPNLHPMTVGYGNHAFNETFYAYKTPDVSTFYNESSGSRKPMQPSFNGQFGKFINMSPDKVKIYWVAAKKSAEPVYISDIEPFGSAGTATYPRHKFIATASNNVKDVLTEWTIEAGNALYYYDVFNSDPTTAQKKLSATQYQLYYLQLQNRAFAHQYRQFTGTDWLALYKQKLAPRFHMWRADYFGQTHVVTTSEIHFVELPPQDTLKRGTSVYGPRPDEISRMRQYRGKYPELTLELKAISCAPRVFEIEGFLSETEVDHMLQLAAESRMKRSGTKAGEFATETADGDTRTSKNTWISRNTDLIIDAIHRRAADVLQMHEALLRWRRKSEIPEFPESMISIAERLQLVHYDVGQQYTPHHDFSMPSLIQGQPSRFATILFYLNDDMEGGETSFPRWLNSETPASLNVKPAKGKAVLFYNMLPDGNYDERSQHAALPVIKGEKYLTNLWVWDPVLDHTATEHI